MLTDRGDGRPLAVVAGGLALARCDRSHVADPAAKLTERAARTLHVARPAFWRSSVLADSGVEHYRGSFQNRAMYCAARRRGADARAQRARRPPTRPSPARTRYATAYRLAALTGLVGTGFHVYNVLKRPGGMSWQNLFYGAPVGAPMAILLSGAARRCAEQVRDSRRRRAADMFGLPAGRVLAARRGAGLLGTAGEAGLLHFRGAYHNPAMFLPVTLPPVAAGAARRDGRGPPDRIRWLTPVRGCA